MSSRITETNAYVQDQATQNNVAQGEYRGEEKMKQYLEKWQNSFEPPRHGLVNGHASGKGSASSNAANTGREVCG